MKLDTKLKKKIKKKIEKIKTQKNLKFFFFGKMKKSKKNNVGKCPIFFTKNPKLGKPKN